MYKYYSYIIYIPGYIYIYIHLVYLSIPHVLCTRHFPLPTCACLHQFSHAIKRERREEGVFVGESLFAAKMYDPQCGMCQEKKRIFRTNLSWEGVMCPDRCAAHLFVREVTGSGAVLRDLGLGKLNRYI